MRLSLDRLSVLRDRERNDPRHAAPLPKPAWLRARLPGGDRYAAIKERLRARGLHTVCEEAQCPNVGECWSEGTATLMLMGDTCTRACRFCAVTTGRPAPLDPGEPTKAAEQVEIMGLDYVVLTSVNRDELDDGGAGHFAATVSAIRRRCPDTLVEVLTPDFQGVHAGVATVLDAGEHVYAHNVETVERLQGVLRDRRASYARSLDVLAFGKRHRRDVIVKSSVMVGAGETDEEIDQTLRDLRSAGVDALTLGQYLRPSPAHHPVERYVSPEAFDAWRVRAAELGFAYAACGPLVRSSYRAGEFYLRRVVLSAR